MVRPPSYDRNGMKKGVWSEEEDNKLRAYIHRYGHWNWRLLPKYAGLARCGKSCRLRWVNYLKPGVTRGNFTKLEQDLIVELHNQLGNKWSSIAAKLPGRTDNDIKNFWHTRIHKRSSKQNPAANKVIIRPIIEEASSNATQVLKKENHTELTTLCKQTGNESQHSSLSFDANLLPDILLQDTDYTQDNYFPPLSDPENHFYSNDLHYNELSSSESSYLSALEWIADYENSIESSDYVAQTNFWSESFESDSLNYDQSETSYIPVQEAGGFYDPSIDHHYFDHGMYLF